MFGFPGRRDWRRGQGDPISIQLAERRIFICDSCSEAHWEETSLFVASTIASLGNRLAGAAISHASDAAASFHLAIALANLWRQTRPVHQSDPWHRAR